MGQYVKMVGKYRQRKLRILLANDNPFQLLIICNSLKVMEDVVYIDQASNGQEALDLVMLNEIDFAEGVAPRAYDLVFLDLGMPLLDGY